MRKKKEVNYTGVKSWTILTSEDEVEVKEIENQGLVDEMHEYLILNFENGDSATFRNSHVDMFIR